MAETSRKKHSGTTKIVEVPQVDQYGHKQPQSLDMEVAVLGALMVEQESYGLVAELLKPESFYDHRHHIYHSPGVVVSYTTTQHGGFLLSSKGFLTLVNFTFHKKSRKGNRKN